MGLRNVSRNIILDVSKSKYVVVQVKQYDKNIREIIAKITDNGRPYGIDNTIVPRIKCKKDDGTYVVNDCIILEDGDIKIDVTDQMTAAAGTHDCELALFDAETDKVIHTMNFIINVKAAVFSDDEVTSSNEFIALENALLKVEKLDAALEEHVASAEESARLADEYETSALESKNNAKTSATEAKIAETKAETSAANAANSESEASTSKNNISTYELIAFRSKNNTVSYESEALSAKNSTVASMDTAADHVATINEYVGDAKESVSQAQQTINQANTMINNLEDTIDTIDANEAQRVSAEKQRVTNETARENNEETRQSNEDTRVSNENARKTAETNRATAESKRVTAENTRVSNENIRVSNEEDRVASEEERETNEATRQTNESTRQSNESTRQGNEETRKTAETQREENEQVREDNEAVREANEKVRIANENTRKTNEGNREAYEAIRQSNEKTRQAGYTEMQETISDMEQTLSSHTSNTSNPHNVTKAQVGLSNVPNVITNDQTPTYSDTTTLSTLTSGEKLSTAFAKIKLAITTLINHISNKSNPHKVTIEQLGYGNIDNTSDADKPVSTAQQSAIDTAYKNSNTYTDTKISELIGGAPDTLNTLKEISDAITENEDVINTLNEAIGTKASQTDLDSHVDNTVVHITSTERTNWNDANSKKHTHSNKSVLDGITSALITAWNSAVTHISDTVKHITSDERTLWNTVSNKVDKVSGKGLSTNDYTTTEKTKLSGIATGAEVNQNAFSNVVVGSTTIAADTKTDTLTLVAGSNVTITPDATNDKITIAATDTNTWRGIQNNLTSTSTSDSLAAAQGKKLNESKLDRAVALTSENLNNMTTPGLYYGGGGNTVTNKPDGVDAFGLFVYHIASGWKMQELTVNNTQKVYTRYYNSSTWSSWVERKFTDTTYSAATSSALGLVKTGSNITNSSGTISVTKQNVIDALGFTPGSSTDNNTTYKLTKSGSTITLTGSDGSTTSVTDSDTNTNTTYTAGTGLTLSGTQFKHSNSVTAGTAQGDTNKTLTFGGTFSIPTVSYDAQGHIIGKGTTTMTMPTYPDLVKQGLTNGNSNLPLLMSDTTISNTSTEYTQVTHRNNNIYANPSIGMIASTSYKLNNKISLEYSTDTDSLNFVFL